MLQQLKAGGGFSCPHFGADCLNGLTSVSTPVSAGAFAPGPLLYQLSQFFHSVANFALELFLYN